jgi:hypothetical protein
MDNIGIEIVDSVRPGQVCILVNNGVIQSKIELDWEDVELDFKDMGKVLRRFPKKVPARYHHEFHDWRVKKELPYLVFGAYAENSGHVFLEVTMRSTRHYKLIRPEADWPRVIDIFESISPTEVQKYEFEGERLVSYTVEPMAIQRLGKLLLKFSDQKYYMIRWLPYSDNDIFMERKHPTPEEMEIQRKKIAWLIKNKKTWGGWEEPKERFYPP